MRRSETKSGRRSGTRNGGGSGVPRTALVKTLGGLRGLSIAALLVVAALAIGWVCIRTTMVRAMAPTSPNVLAVASGDPNVVLANASIELVRQHGILRPATLRAVRTAVAAAPLDARAYMVLGHQQLLDREPRRALATLEAGQRLDPRQQLIHILLLDRYLRTGRYEQAAAQFSVLARLVGQTQAPIANAMAAMSLMPETRDAVRRTLATDAVLERAVLTALVRSDTPTPAIFALASPKAEAEAGYGWNWGPVLVARLVERGRFAEARRVWQRIHRLSDATLAAPIFNAGLVSSPASAPFNWTLVSGSLGVSEMRQGGLAVEYYGRESGNLAAQLLTLRPGRYRFSVLVDPGKTDNSAGLFWTIACADVQQPALMNLRVTAAATRRRLAGDFTVPAGCSAQGLTLRGEAGEFPVTISVTLRQPDISPLQVRSGARP